MTGNKRKIKIYDFNSFCMSHIELDIFDLIIYQPKAFLLATLQVGYVILFYARPDCSLK